MITLISITEDYLINIIDTGFKGIKTDINQVNQIISTDAKRVDMMKAFLLKNSINIRKGFPRTPAELPCICISISKEEETEDTLGDYDIEGDTEIIETMFEQNFNMEVWSPNADLTVDIYYLLKWLMLANRTKLIEEAGLFRQKLTGGDLSPAPSFFPEFVYRRGLSLWAQRIETVPEQQLFNISDVSIKETIVFDTGLGGD